MTTNNYRETKDLVNNCIPYNEMSNEEISRVIEYWAEVKSNELKHKEKMQKLDEEIATVAKEYADLSNHSKAVFDELVSAALDNYKKSR